jgi:hypothetical protein
LTGFCLRYRVNLTIKKPDLVPTLAIVQFLDLRGMNAVTIEGSGSHSDGFGTQASVQMATDLPEGKERAMIFQLDIAMSQNVRQARSQQAQRDD